MGSNLSRESTLAVSSTPKPDPTVQRIRNERLAHLIDPRSPSTDIGRTPIQVAAASETSKVVTNGCALPSEDPRSPTIGITRTPVRDDMQVTVGSLARRLGILFYNEAASVSVAPPGRFSKPSNLNVEEENPITVNGELGSMKPLLACQPPQNFGTMAQHANLLSTPVKTHPLSTGDMSPFVLLEDLQIEVEADLTLEEAEEARESPVHKRLSMSLITCHEGAASSHIFAEVHCDSPSPVAAVETSRVGPDHSYAHASVTHEPASPQSPAQLDVPTMTEVSVSSEQLEEAQVSSSIETEESDTVPEPLMLLTTPADLEPHTSVALEPQTTPAALEPHTSVVREPQTTPAALEPQVTPATPEPIVPEAQAIPAAIEPQITPATPEPIVPEAQTTPAALEPHTSVALEPQTTPSALEPQITPATPEPIVPEAQVTPAALEPQITPATPEPIVSKAQVTPAALEPQVTHATPQPQIVPEDQVTPAVLEPQITPEAQPMPTTLELQTTVTTTLKPPAVVGPTPSPQEVQSCKGLRCPNLKTKSPSQVVFKPQWLGKGFGATGLRARGVQAGRSKGGSSPLAVRVAVKNVFNDTRGQSTKPKDKGEGRSPLQILKETNSPREQSSQMKVKVSTPDRQRLGQLDRRTLAVSLDKENR